MKKYLPISLVLLLSAFLAVTFLTCGGGQESSEPSGDIPNQIQFGGYVVLHLLDDGSGEKSYQFHIQVKDSSGNKITDQGLIQDVKILEYPSLTEVPLSNSWNLMYYPSYVDRDGNGPDQPSPIINFSYVNGYLDVPVGELSEGFYKGVVTHDSGEQYETWLYCELPSETDKIQESSMIMTDIGNGLVTLSWTNPGNLDPSKQFIRVYVNTTDDLGEGFDGIVLSVHLKPVVEHYTIPASEVTRLKGYSSLNWHVQVRQEEIGVTNPDSTTKTYLIYRNNSPKQTLILP
jgi:hypothetical protein